VHVEHEAQVLRLGPDERVGRAYRLSVDEPDRGGRRVAAVRGGGSAGVFPGLLGDQAEAGRHQLHGLGQAGGGGDVAGLQVLFGALAGQQRPRVTRGGRDRLAPGVGRRGDERSRVGLVLIGLEHVGGQPVLAAHRGVGGGGESGQGVRRLVQRAVVTVPSRQVLLERVPERLDARPFGQINSRDGGGPETERQGERRSRRRIDQRRQCDVAVLGRLVLAGQRVADVELAEAVAGTAAAAPDAPAPASPGPTIREATITPVPMALTDILVHLSGWKLATTSPPNHT